MVEDLSMLLAVSAAFRSLESAMYGIIALYISTVLWATLPYPLHWALQPRMLDSQLSRHLNAQKRWKKTQEGAPS